MKKTILAIAIAMVSTTALADGYIGSDLANGAFAGVAGSVGSSSINGSGPSGAVMGSNASSFSISGDVSNSNYYRGDDASGGHAVTGTIAIGGAKASAVGHTYGNGLGINGAAANYQANAAGHANVNERGVHLDATSGASTQGGASALVEGTGTANSWTVSGAGNISGVMGGKTNTSGEYSQVGDWVQTDSYKGGKVRFNEYERTGQFGSTDIDSANMAGGSLSGAGSASGANSTGGGSAAAGSNAFADGSVNGRIVTRGGDVNLNGLAGSNAGAGSGVSVAGNDSALAAAGNYSGAGFLVKGTNTSVTGGEYVQNAKTMEICRTEFPIYLGHWSPTGNEYLMEINTAYASDYKVTKSDSYVSGPGAEASAYGNAWVNASAQAGDKIEVAEGDEQSED